MIALLDGLHGPIGMQQVRAVLLRISAAVVASRYKRRFADVVSMQRMTAVCLAPYYGAFIPQKECPLTSHDEHAC